MLGVVEFRYESTPTSYFSIVLILGTIAAWLTFFVANDKIRRRIRGENQAAVADLLSLMGTLLAAFTLLGIGFFVFIAPRLK